MSHKKNDEVTPEHFYLNRKQFLKTSIYAASAIGTTALYRWFRKPIESVDEPTIVQQQIEKPVVSQLIPSSFESITNYNNFYEFSTDKEAVASAASRWKIPSWTLAVDGLVENPISLDLTELYRLQMEERIYRFRCVEGWSMVIPWMGFPLARLLEKVKPKSEAKYVAFETYFNEIDMPDAYRAGIKFPYVEGLRLDEALNPLTFMATGLYKKNLLNQNGPPVRLVVPWKYGFKSIKSVTKISLVAEEPPTTWNIAAPAEYGFYSNVNPDVDHPRWSQKKERRIGELGRRDTEMFNGYEKEVAHLYAGMDLRKYF